MESLCRDSDLHQHTEESSIAETGKGESLGEEPDEV